MRICKNFLKISEIKLIFMQKKTIKIKFNWIKKKKKKKLIFMQKEINIAKY